MLGAFLLGFLGSIHCVGMCGPIAASLPGSNWTVTKFAGSRLLYNLGRIITYAFLGLIVGGVGYGAQMFLVQRYFSLAVGVILLAWGFYEAGWVPFLKKKGGPVLLPLRNYLASWFRKGTLLSVFGIGLANGLLPCGFVYMGLFLAGVEGTPLRGATTMMLFGLGTFPAMLLISYSVRMVASRVSSFFTRTMPYMMLLFGMLFVLRGMALGIPYVSPRWVENENGKGGASCCHAPEKAAPSKEHKTGPACH